MSLWRRLLGDRPIVTRLVLAVAGTMAVVLPGAGAFVFSRVELRYGTVTLTATQTGERTRLTMSDEGPGFAPVFVDKAFDRFTRADSGRSTRGTGLGLALVRAVAEAHGGTATIAGPAVGLDLPTRDARA